MSILVTGGTGYIGSHTVVELLNSGEDVIIVDNLYNSKLTVLDKIEKITGKRPKFYHEDAADRAAMDKIFAENSIEAVIHFAGLKAVGESVRKPLDYYRVNLDTAVVTMETMRKYGCKCFIFSSSATVYGEPKTVPIREDFPVATPTSPYGTEVAARRLPELHVYGDDYPTKDGTGIRDYIHVVDLAVGHIKALRHRSDRGVFIYNLGTGIGYSVFDIIRTFEKVNGITIPYTVTGRRPGDIAEYYADPTKAYRELGWKAEHNLEDMCRSAWHFIQGTMQERTDR